MRGRLCAVTFTKDAAEELKSRILAACGEGAEHRVAVGTFHSLARHQLVKKFGKAKVRIIGDGERFSLLRRAYDLHHTEHSFDTVVQAIDAAKASISRFALPPGPADVYRSYQELLASEGVMDMSDLLLRTVDEMKSGALPPMPIRWMLVDEAQDMDEVQLEWVKLHAQKNIDVTLVGDDDQSLYSFRYALGYQGLRSFIEEHAAQELSLPVNYRCASNILGHAAKLIARNKDRATKMIEAHRKDDGVIDKLRLADRWDESSKLADEVKESQDPHSWAVLARTNRILNETELVFSTQGIPYYRVGSKSVWEKSAPSALMGLLRSAGDGSWIGISNALYFAGCPSSAVNRLASFEGRDCVTKMESALASREVGDWPPDMREMIVGLAKRMADWRQQSRNERASLVIRAVIAWISERARPDDRAILERLAEPLCKLHGSILQRIHWITSHNKSDGDGKGSDSKGKGVALLTLHASKGLEFDNVWIVGAEDGLLPHVDATIDEERRLMYVGMTRAKHRLVISSAMNEGKESSFLAEAGL